MPIRPSPTSRAARRAAFTLIELLAVLIIISILAWVLVSNLTGAVKAIDVEATRTRMQQIALAIQEYTHDQGEPPRSRLPQELGSAPNEENLGAECLYLALCGEGGEAFGKFEDALVNTDGDQLSKRPQGFQKPTLFEIGDQWGNPIAYFHNKDYKREDAYVSKHPDTDEELVTRARAKWNDETGNAYEPNGFQLLSAGPDGEFGTDDDITAPFRVKKGGNP